MRLEDARQRWAGTVILIDNTPVLVNEVATKTSQGKFLLVGNQLKNNTWEPTSIEVAPECINELVPELGNLQIGKYAMHATRSASHQFKRGFVDRQVSIYVIKAPSNKHRVAAPPIYSPEVLNSVYFRKYPPFNEAYRSVMAGEFGSRCVSKDLSLVADISRWPTLYYKTMPVGICKPDVVELAAPAGMLRELVQETAPCHVVIR